MTISFLKTSDTETGNAKDEHTHCHTIPIDRQENLGNTYISGELQGDSAAILIFLSDFDSQSRMASYWRTITFFHDGISICRTVLHIFSCLAFLNLTHDCLMYIEGQVSVAKPARFYGGLSS